MSSTADRIANFTIVRIPYALPPAQDQDGEDRGEAREGTLSVAFDESFTNEPDDVNLMVLRRESGGLSVRQNKALAAVRPGADNVLELPRALLGRGHLSYQLGDRVPRRMEVLGNGEEEGRDEGRDAGVENEEGPTEEKHIGEGLSEEGHNRGLRLEPGRGSERGQEQPQEHGQDQRVQAKDGIQVVRQQQLGQWADRAFRFAGMALTNEESEQASIWRGAVTRFLLLVLLVWLAPRVLASMPDEVQTNLMMIFVAFVGYMFVVFGFGF
ncbi:hypothetical protein NKR19_g7471 [Coniochaeta hoffmannii]|uniref:Uncharacterized protein n=1 Tax=Coniochaeta hoffmannii TaxID=91930 RepID=A0AA38VD49_9PEZI|nr:hypothetical protein NKR19_g7471 [Coniochaeta hoffmannii]